MKKIIYTVVIGLVAIISSCDDHLDTDNLYEKSLDTFYRTPTDIEEAMNGVYNALFVGGVHSNEHVAANLMSDVMLGGGGPDDKSAKDVDNFLDPAEDTYRDLWKETYNGVSRANAVIEAVQLNDFKRFFETAAEAEAFKNNTLGEAYFMRGFLMYRAARFFGGMPIISTTDADRGAPRSSLSETWAFIASDFKAAAELLPKRKAADFPLATYGHANVWVAKAYIARAYLYYTGYMTNVEKQAADALPLYDGGSISKADVIAHLEDVRDNSGYKLASDFRNLWPYSYVNQNARDYDPEGTHPVLPWAENEGLEWVGQDGPNSSIGTGNHEVMFALRYGLADWSFGQQYNNRVCLFFGIRDHSMVPFGQGWGWGTVHNAFYNSWSDDDPRKQGSVIDLNSKDPDMGVDGWNIGKGDHNTGLTNKKYTTIQHNGPDGVKGMFYYLLNMVHGDPMQLWAAQDFYYLRFADILLMHSELTQTADGINAVRERAGLDPVAYTIENLKDERLHEFAFEGLRWFDLVRWGDAESGNNYFGVEAAVNNSGTEGSYKVSYRPETKGLVPVPEGEIRLSNGVYEQNPGW
ncbi:RagB/SusD family nutrient uptake outer membrane protein [Carboxylicivirga mesophila]|uniref:RagB/SusD family nutrient uptake outer membrane protein n=1 Tax=Carboxylicivirga mesophila TaxID=1166478 RepID=A0ABS5K8Y8_9BACT|nr:RagB/SusD family nutrient uptake outer membrane protein [Carboxylicivirga mesophila]MBS2211420.1 RagB/SusD family nutrient uptake outer membrane protein [Carboxylicivirga mesophila]